MRTLYYEIEPILAGGFSAISGADRARMAEDRLRTELGDMSEKQVERFIARQYPSYWLRTDPQAQLDQARIIAAAEAEQRELVIDVTSDAVKAVTELTIFAPSHPRLLSMIAGACAASDANIVSAQISTTRDGMALDVIHLQREFERSDDEVRRGQRIGTSIENLLSGETSLEDMVAKKQPMRRRMRAFSVEPQVMIDNTLSDELTVIEVNGLDRPGLLYDLTRELGDLMLDIASAQIATFGEKAVDVFYVTDLTGKKISNAVRQTAIRHRLTRILSPSNAKDKVEAAAS